MKVLLQQLLDHVGIDGPMGPYGSRMWTADDDDKGLTCSAQASMNGDSDELDLVIEVFHSKPKPDTPDHEPILVMHFRQDINKKWSPDVCRVKKDSQVGKLYEWEKKGCDFFLAVITALARNTVPDLDALIERIFKANDTFGSGTAGGGKRNPTIRPEQLLNPNKKF
jgi:hypothetical protein